MQGDEFSTEGSIHKYCSVECNPLDSHGKGQQEFTSVE